MTQKIGGCLAGIESAVAALDGSRSQLAARYRPCLTLLRERSTDLTSAERRIADVILRQPTRAVVFTSRELASASGVGMASVTRLCAKLGYTSYSDMRIGIAVELLDPGQGGQEPVPTEDDAATVTHRVMQYAAQSLQDAAKTVDARELERAATAIVRARRMDLYAIGGLTASFAAFAQHRFLLLGVPSTVFTSTWQMNMAASTIGPEDVAIAVSYSGVPDAVRGAIEAATQAGATTICITNTPDSPIAQVASIQLASAARELWSWRHSAGSHHALLGVVESLYALTLLRKHGGTTG